MKFICDRQVLAKALNTVSKAVSSRTTIPILKGILLEVKDGHLTMSASDLDISIEKVIEVNAVSEGSVVVLSRLFGDIIRKLPNGEIMIEEKEAGNITIKSAASEFTIIGLSADEFPNIKEEQNESDKLIFNRELFIDMIRKTTFAASIDESKGVIVGVLIELTDNSMNMVALDGFRMAVAREQMKNAENKKIIIAAKILNDISKIISENEDEETITVMLGDKKAMILMENTKVVLRLLKGEFIKYKDILPKTNKCTVKLRRDDLTESIERASLLAKEGKNNLIKIMTESDKMTITSRSDEGNVREEVNILREGEDLEIGFNSKYILDVLKVIDDEEIIMEFNTSITPCMIKPVEGDSFEYLILPVRI